MHETTETQKLKTKFVNRDVAIGGNKQILEFIAEVRFQCSPACSTDTSIETIRYLFEAGYCYYFARMLEDAFPGGEVCLMYPFGHITYVYDGIIYDIGGVSDAEYESLIPIKYLDNTISVFKHNGSSDVSREDGNKKYVKRFTANFYILLLIIVLSFAIDLVKCFYGICKVI